MPPDGGGEEEEQTWTLSVASGTGRSSPSPSACWSPWSVPASSSAEEQTMSKPVLVKSMVLRAASSATLMTVVITVVGAGRKFTG